MILNNHKLNLNQFPQNFHLIAIHSDLNEFRLAYFLNEKLNISLIRRNNDIHLAENNAYYPSYEFLDETKYLKWIFFSNKSLISEKTNDDYSDLFSQQDVVKSLSFIDQPKGVDYFLIIENVKNKGFVQKVLRKISEIRGVITSYLSEKKLENKENLIFS